VHGDVEQKSAAWRRGKKFAHISRRENPKTRCGKNAHSQKKFRADLPLAESKS
jgi:hypothetical protein